jgi:Na+-transporting NADH:ubiquinone oxidoreductase subunit A
MKQIFTHGGINLPFKGTVNVNILKNKDPKIVYIDLSPYTYLSLKATKKIGEKIVGSEVIAFDKNFPKRVYLSPYFGKIIDIFKAEKQKIVSIAIEIEEMDSPPYFSFSEKFDKNELMDIFFQTGLSFFIHKRPLERVIGKNDFPRSIFINTVVSAPFAPSFTYILKENEEIFQKGIFILSKIAPIHLIYNEKEFSNFSCCSCHQIFGVHPIESPSIHIMAIDPILSEKDIIWSLDVYDVLQIGSVFSNKGLFTEKIISLGGLGFSESTRTLIKTKKGAKINDIATSSHQIIAGDPLTGLLGGEYIREKDFAITSFIKEEKKECIPFLKLGINKFSVTNTYFGRFFKGFFKNKDLNYKLGGEERPFILKDIYKKALPLNIYIEPLIKALLAKDYPLAIDLGFLEIEAKDLALAEYICPSKIPLMHFFKVAKKDYLQLFEEN